MYSMLLYNYRVTRAVENFKEGKQMSHNKILRTVFGISTGALLFGMNMMQVPFASENITETEPQSISEENTDVIDNQKLLEIDQDQLDTGVVYVTTKDTYFYFPDGCSDDANLLGWAVKWMHETWYQNSENDIDVSAKVFVISEETQDDTITLFGITSYESNADYTGKYAVSATFEKDSENTFKFVDYWEPLDSDEIKSIEARFPEEDWETAEDMMRYDELLSDEEEVTGTCIVVSGDTPAEIIADLYDKTR